MKNSLLILSVLMICLPLQANESVSASKFSSYMVGAEQVRISQGEDSWRGVMNQALVTYIETNLNNQTGPVMMVPDVGLSTYVFARTPDNRDGWLEIFAQMGHDAYAYDWINTGNSPQNILPFALLNEGVICYAHQSCEQPDHPLLQRIDKLQPAEIWPAWGFGPEQGQSYADSQYPTERIMQLYSSLPAFATYVNNDQDVVINARNLIEALQDNGSANLVLHGSASETGIQVARLRPDLVRSLVLLEPSSCAGLEQIEDVPVLAVYGDYLEARGMTGSLANCTDQLSAYRRAGSMGDILTLAEVPDLGNRNTALSAIRIPANQSGNSHLMMQDRNNAEVAGMISRWIAVRQ